MDSDQMQERKAEGFVCAICQHSVNTTWPAPRQISPLPPVCRYCEQTWGGRPPNKGAFKDRRVAAHIHAIAEALETEARHQHYRRFGYAAERL